MSQPEPFFLIVLGLVNVVSVSFEMIESIRFGAPKGQTMEFQLLFSWHSFILPPPTHSYALCSLLGNTAADAPAAPESVTMKYISIDPKTIEFRWTPAEGDFDSYVLVYYNKDGEEVDQQVIEKGETSFQYKDDNPDVKAYSFHTLKDTTRSASAPMEAETATFVREQLSLSFLALHCR